MISGFALIAYRTLSEINHANPSEINHVNPSEINHVNPLIKQIMVQTV